MNIELPMTESLSPGSSLEAPRQSDDNALDEEQGVLATECTMERQNPERGRTTPPPNALMRKLMAMREQRRRLTVRQRVAIVIGTLPVAICSLEMIPDRCHLCRQDMELDAYFFTAAMCGGFAAVIYGDSLDYWMPRLLGGSISALGSLFTVWMLLTSVPTNLAFLFVFVGILGAMPGIVIYFLLKIVADECFASDVEDDYEEIAPLTKIRITSAD